MDDLFDKPFIVIPFGLTMLALSFFLLGIGIDYWNGSARATLIAKRGGPELTWREGAQIKQIEIKDLNINIRFDGASK